MTVTINGTTGVTTPEVTLDNSSADGGQVVLKSTGYSNWNIDNYNGSLRSYYGSTVATSIDTSGNVGIGTSNPSYKLEVLNANATDTLVVKSTTADVTPYLSFDVKGISGGQYIRGRIRGASPSNTAGGLVFETGDSGSTSERMRIDSSGNLLVGTVTPGNAGSQGLTIASGKYIWSVGTYANTTATAANMVVNSDGSFARSTSALKYKDDIRNLESVDINKFRPVRYKSKCESDDQTVDHFGIIADEVDAAGIKELVNYGADGEVEGFQYERLTVVLLKAIQELKAEVDALKGAK